MDTIKRTTVIITGRARTRTSFTSPGDEITATKTPTFWSLVNHATGARFACTADYLRRFVDITAQITTGPQAGEDATQ